MNIYAPRYTNAGDSKLASTSLLMTTIGIGGATNNTFRDDGPTNFLPTRNGDTTQGTFSPFGALSGGSDPTAVGGSVFFDGTGDYLTAPAGYLTGIGTGDFTVEGWWNFSDFTIHTTYYQRLWSFGTGPANDVTLNVDTSGVLAYRNNDTALITASTAMTLNNWNHVALSRASGTTRLYLNGVLVGSTATSNDLTSRATSPFYVGCESNGAGGYFIGYASNIRVTNTAVYTAAFTPSPAPLTTVTGTSLLTCQSATTVTDASTNNFTVTRVGDARPNTFTPFGYGSTYFDGGTTYISAADNAALQMGSGDFTVELWWFPTTLTGYQTLFDKGYNTAGGLALQTSSASLSVVIGGAVPITAGAFVANTWHHIAVTRSGSTVTLYVNGISVGTGTSSATLNSTHNLGIGASTNQTGNGYYPATGYISNVRVVKGTAVYTAAFTPPTAPLTAISGTSLLALTCGCRTADDSSNGFIFTRYGGVRVTKETPFAQKSGNWSTYLDGTGDYLSVAGDTSLAFGTGDFTIECWMNLSATGSAYGLTDFRPTSTNGLYPDFYYSGTGLNLYVSTGDQITGTATILPNTWYHVACCRSSGSTRLFLNGTQVGSTYADTNSYLCGTNRPMITGHGYLNNSSNSMYGYLSNLRILKGTGLYTSAFTPPAAPLTAIPGTSLLTAQSNRIRDNSPGALAITAYGDTAVSKFSPFPSPQVATSVISTGSVYFDGSTSCLTVPNSSQFDFGTGDFTVEAYVNPSSTGTNKTFLSTYVDSVNGWALGYRDTNNFQLGVGDTSLISCNWGSSNSWIHVAVTRSGTNLRMFFNGIQQGATVTNSTNITSTNALQVGRIHPTWGQYFYGYVSNARIVKGQALYTANFTPPTSPLTAITGTSLLTCQSASTITDASTNAFTITKNASPTEATPFKRVTYPYGGSAYFDGTGDYLTLPAPSGQIGAGDFTVETWVYPVARLTSYPCVWGNYSTWGAGALGLFVGHASATTTKYQIAHNNTFPALESSSSIIYNAWTHLAMVRTGGVIKLYVNGVSEGTPFASTATLNQGTTASWVGTPGDQLTAGNFNGYISNLRVIVGTAAYLSNFTPPVAPVTAIGGTGLLLNFDNAGIYDSVGGRDFAHSAGTKLSTTAAKFGAASLSPDTAAQPTWIAGPVTDFVSGTGDFTIEAWVNNNTVTGAQVFYDGRPWNTNGVYPTLYINGTQLRFYVSTADRITGGTLAAGTWYHVAVCRASGTTRMFLNGTQVGSDYADANSYLTALSRPIIGGNAFSNDSHWNGYMDDVRITRSARYTTTFAPPTSALAQSSLPSSMSSTRTSEMIRSSLF